MEFITSINQITWPAAFAIVGSVVTIVVGLFGYMRSSKAKQPDATQAVHSRVSNLRDAVADLEGDYKALEARLDAYDRSLHEHEARDVSDFRALSDKVEKIMEIIVEMLRQAK
jgi:uncharacterized protein YlxW (UPF0749 family)